MRFILLLALCLGLVEECVAQFDPIANQQKGECTECSCANDTRSNILEECKPNNCTAKCLCKDENDIGQQGSCRSTPPTTQPSPSPSPLTCDCASQKAYREQFVKCYEKGGSLQLLQSSQGYVACGHICQAECSFENVFIIDKFGICGRFDFPCECKT